MMMVKFRKILLIIGALIVFDSYKVTSSIPNYALIAANDSSAQKELADSKLSSIKLNNQSLEYFSPNILEYDIEVEQDVDSIVIYAEKEDDKASISGDLGTKKLDYGINTFYINIKGDSEKTTVYTLNITRIDRRSTDNKLKSLTLSNIDISFKPDVLEYDILVDNKVEKAKIQAELNNNKAVFEQGFGNREETLNEGSNKLLIKVLSESGDERVYTLNINRALSGNNTLKSLMFNDEKIDLKENEFIYNIECENNVSEAIIKAVPSDSKAKVNIKDKYQLEVGQNDINIEITAPDGSRASYILNVTRKKILSNNSRLANIKIVGHKFGFNPELTSYYLKIKDDEDKLDIYTVLEDTTATVEIEGNKDLIDGSIIKINVRAEDGTYTRYFINIEKNRKSNTLTIIILILIFLCLLAICIWNIIKRNKRKTQVETIKEETKEPEINTIGNEISIEASDYEKNEDIKLEEKDMF